MGWLPVFYWPRLTGDADDLEPPLRQIAFRTNNYFGQQVLTDWNGFKVFGLRRPELDRQLEHRRRLPERADQGLPGAGQRDGLVRPRPDPRPDRPLSQGPDARPEHSPTTTSATSTSGASRTAGNDVLGSGPAIVTNGPAGAGKRGFQRIGRARRSRRSAAGSTSATCSGSCPTTTSTGSRTCGSSSRSAYVSDRHFLEEYYKRLIETGMDQETLAYMQYQKNNRSWDLWAEANLQNFYTDTQWLPRLDYYRLGDSLVNNWFNYYQHSGVDYANTHTDIMVNNPNLFAFMPYDPISNTSGVFSGGAGLHEPRDRHAAEHLRRRPGRALRAGPGGRLDRPDRRRAVRPAAHRRAGPIWGAAGVHTEMMAWKIYPDVENEILNIHGLNNKISFFADFRAAYSNQSAQLDRRPGRPRRQHLRVRPPLLRDHELDRRRPARSRTIPGT